MDRAATPIAERASISTVRREDETTVERTESAPTRGSLEVTALACSLVSENAPVDRSELRSSVCDSRWIAYFTGSA